MSEPTERSSSPPAPRALVARVIIAAAAAGAASGGILSLVLTALDHRDPFLHVWVMVASVTAALVALWVVQAVLGRRVGRLVRLFERKGAGRAERGRERAEGEDLGRALAAMDRLLAQAEMGSDTASGEGDADQTSPLGQTLVGPTLREETTSTRTLRDAAESQRERDLSKTLSQKTAELEQRLRERALLFELLRESVTSLDLERVLDRLTSRLGPALELRELAVLLRDESGRFAVRACWGFPSAEAVLGRSLEPGQGVTSSAVASGKAIVVDDVSESPDYLAFWGEVPRTGSFMSVPIRVRDEVIGAIALTRPPSDPLTDLEGRFLSALADQVALSIHNAQLFRKLEELSTIDELTKLPNRRYLHERLAREMADARRYGHPLSLLMIDVDHFKKLNDRSGHPIGDAALVLVAERLSRSLREVDTIARWGGEEFVVLLSHANEADALEVAEKLRRVVTEIDTPWAREQPFGHLSLSIGVAVLREGDDSASLVQRADRAVYVAKREGRDRVSLPPRPSQPEA
ncbi:MAG: sensor domain-containing diguanylate cyclase [Sandaracinus sp.]